MLLEHNDAKFKGIVALDVDGNIVWYYEVPEAERENEISVLALAQKNNYNIVYLSLYQGFREIAPDGRQLERLDSPCTPPDVGPWHHEVLLRPGNTIWFLGSELHEPSPPLKLKHGPQVIDTIEEWNQDSGKTRRLFDLFDFQSLDNRTTSSDGLAFESPTAWAG